MKKKQLVPFAVAVDQLIQAADLDLLEGTAGEFIKGGECPFLDKMRETFAVVHHHLQAIAKDEKKISDVKTQHGIHAVMRLAEEAAEKLDRITHLFYQSHHKTSQLKEFCDLQEFYTQKIASRFKIALQEEEAWLAAWGGGEEGSLDVQRQSLKDLETVKRDRAYELFWIFKEDGTPFFNRNLLRHLRLVRDFDALIDRSQEQDPLLQLPCLIDKELHARAVTLVQDLKPHLTDFLHKARTLKEKELAQMLLNAIYALLLASQHHNLLGRTSAKCVKEYFSDFHQYLRKALESTEYRHLITLSEEELSLFDRRMVQVAELLAFAFFTSRVVYEEMSGLIDQLTRHAKTKGMSFWNDLLDGAEEMATILRRYPSGPLLKVFDAFQEDHPTGFDPLAQGNFPSRLFALDQGSHKIHFLRIPCPTEQVIIHKAAVALEFRGFMRHLARHPSLSPLLILNFQNRLSFQERARSEALEALADGKTVFAMTFAVGTDFDLQIGEYLEKEDVSHFKREFLKQMETEGWCFSGGFPKEERNAFIQQTLDTLHTECFKERPTLSRQERIDLITLTHLFFALKCVEVTGAKHVTLLCKDGVDTSMAMNAGLFALTRILADKGPLTEEEKNFLSWLSFGPALQIRERSIDLAQLHRMVSALNHLSQCTPSLKKLLDGGFKHPHLGL